MYNFDSAFHSMMIFLILNETILLVDLIAIIRANKYIFNFYLL